MVKDAEAHAEDDRKQVEVVRRATRSTRWCTSSRSRSREYGDKLDADEKAKIEAAVKEAEELLKNKDATRTRSRRRPRRSARPRRSSARTMYAEAQAKAQGRRPEREGARRRRRDKKDEKVVDAEYTEVKDKKYASSPPRLARAHDGMSGRAGYRRKGAHPSRPLALRFRV